MTLRAFGSLFGERYGDLPPRVLALHGWGRTRGDFDSVLSGYDALAVDLPGFGASPPPDHAVGAAGYARLMEPILAEFERPPVVVGHSFGGRVAVAMAAARPESVSGLVLLGVPLLRRVGPKPRVPWKYRLIRSARRLRLISEDKLERARKEYGSADYRAASGVMRDILVTAVNETYERELAVLTCPVRLVWGERDSAAPLAIARAALPMIADGSLEVVPEAGHDVHLSHAGRVQAAIDGLL